MPYPSKGPVSIFGCFWGADIVKAEYNFKNNSKYDKDNWTNNFVENLNMYFKQKKVTFADTMSLSETCDDFSCGFWDAKIVKREYNLKNIRKSLKRTLTNNFVENFKIWSKGHNQIQTMPHPFKGPVTVVGYFGGESTIKTEHKLRNISKHDKNNLSNNFVKRLNMYFKKHK